MMTFTLNEIAEILGLPATANNVTISGLSRDTRTLTSQNLYVAITGEQFNGHDFIKNAAEKGAAAALVSQPVSTTLPYLTVNDTIQSMGQISAIWRNRFTLPLIGVTGSCGKTTLKNMIAAILRAEFGTEKVLATEGNLNNHIGVPLMLAQLSSKHHAGVIEMGTNNFGEIEYLTQLVKPQVAIINNVGAAHLQGLQTVEGVARAKGEIFLSLAKDGTAVLNRDDAFYDYFRDLTKNYHQLSFSLEHSADITTQWSEGNDTFIIKTPRGEITVNLPLLGKHNVLNALAATACTLALNVSLAAIKSGLESVTPAPGRMRQHTLANGTRVIDDTYNANPSSTAAAIHTLASFADTKILILGDMRELGENADQLHYSIGQQAKQAGIHYLFTYGELTQNATEAFGEHAEHFQDQEKLYAVVKEYMQPKTTILVKGSRSMKMEKIVNLIISH